jgi:MtN3 and saliva related transmembrane protein
VPNPSPLFDLVGYAAAALTTASFVPQAIKSWSTRDLSGISLTMYALFTLGVALWMLYGLAIGSLPVILANAVTLALAGTVLFLKLRHSRRE